MNLIFVCKPAPRLKQTVEYAMSRELRWNIAYVENAFFIYVKYCVFYFTRTLVYKYYILSVACDVNCYVFKL